MPKKKSELNFEEYIRQGEPDKKEKASIWRTAIGLQAVDGLKTSDYLKETACKHIEGKIDIDEARKLIRSYYESKSNREPDDDEKQEADEVSANIAKILSADTLNFSAQGLVSLHRRIFEKVFKHAGKIRTYNITKKEWVLNGDTVRYLNWEDLNRALEFDIEQEKSFSYKGVSSDELIAHVTKFVSGIWQIHAFSEGNTRTTAVFAILYLRSLGFKVNNDMFADHSWYFRNALVRANYRNAIEGIDYSPVYLERFFRNLLLGDRWDLRNRYLHIQPSKEWRIQPNLAGPTGTRRVPIKYPSSTHQVPDKLHSDNPNITKLVEAVGEQTLSVREMMASLELKDRVNFQTLYLSPAIEDGFVKMLYPNSPRHPRQKYLLTAKGFALYLELAKGNNS
jgi:fido (protein-threonine AMPylation protein)